MRNKLSALVFLFLLPWNTLLPQAGLKENGHLSQLQLNLITKYTSGFPDHTQLSIAFIKGNNVSYAGIVKVGNILLPVENRDSVFEIGSITKLFTSTLLAGLVKENVMNLNDPVENTLPYGCLLYTSPSPPDSTRSR